MKKIFVSLALANTLLFSACHKDPPPEAPVANFTYVMSDEYAPSEVTFTNTSQHAASYEWDFGNGQTSTETSPKVTYVNGGTYAVKLTAKQGGKNDQKTISLTIQGPPSANFTIDQLTSYAPMPIKMVNTSQNADTYNWEFSWQNQTSTDPSPEFMCPEPGTYTITLKAKKGTRENELSKTLVVGADPDLVAYYPFPGNAFDYSGKDNDANLRFGANYADGRKGGDKALNLPVANYTTIKPSAQMPDGLLKNTGASTTISLWFFANSTGKGCLLSYMNTDLYAGGAFTEYVPAAYFYQDKLYIKLWNGSMDPLIIKEGITTNTWHHLVLAGDGTGFSAYVDGALAGTVPGAITYLNMTYNYLGAGFLALNGNWPGCPTDIYVSERFYFNGRIDDVRIYKKKISEAEVAALFKE